MGNTIVFRRAFQKLRRLIKFYKLRRLIRKMNPYRRRYVWYTVYMLKGWLKKLSMLLSQQVVVRQSILEWDVNWPEFRTSEQLEAWLKSNEVRFSTGLWTIYLPPQPSLRRVLGEVVDFYPPSAGYKILKNFGSPHQTTYCSEITGGLEELKRQKRRGGVFDSLQNANFLYACGLGPRCWDLTAFRTSHQSYTVFVVENVQGLTPNNAQHQAFLAALRDLETRQLLDIVVPGKWEEHIDFRVPDCNGNLISQKETNQPKYVDFQNLVVNSQLWSKVIIERYTDTFHFGDSNPLTFREFLYQSVPGFNTISKRNVHDRWTLIESELKALDISIRNRIVLDIGSNQGMMMLYSLRAGAAWCQGWDRPEVVKRAESLLFSLGASRFHLAAAELNVEYLLTNDLPQRLLPQLNEAVILYLSVRKHIGMMRNLETLPWRVLVYEGHQDEDLNSLPQILAPLLDERTELRRAMIRSDGPGRVQRPMAILVRRKELES